MPTDRPHVDGDGGSTTGGGLKRRFDALDQARAIAIGALLVAHFGPAMIERLDPPEVIGLALAAFGRFATPGFVAVFGISIGLVYLPKARRDWPQVARRLLQRSAWLILFSVVIRIDQYISLLTQQVDSPVRWLLATYSILVFYTLALAVMPLILLGLRARPVAISVTGAGILWLIGGWSGFAAWPAYDVVGYPELARLVLVSGRYGFFSMLGTAMAFVPLGWWIRLRMESGAELAPMLRRWAVAGAAAVAGGCVYAAWCDMTPWEVVRSPGGPPRIWFFALMAGAVPVLIYVLDRLNRVRIMPLAMLMTVGSRLGRVALPVYVGHAFVIPGAVIIRYLLPGISDLIVLPVMFLAFAIYTAAIVVLRTDLVAALGPSTVSAGPRRGPLASLPRRRIH